MGFGKIPVNEHTKMLGDCLPGEGMEGLANPTMFPFHLATPEWYL